METNSPRSAAVPWIVGGAMALAVLVGAIVMRSKQPEEAEQTPGVGQPLPMLDLQPLVGTNEGTSLQDLRGKVTLINYWGPWCGWCIKEFPSLIELWEKYRGNPEFAFISVSSDGTFREDVEKLKSDTEQFLKSRGWQLPVYVDPNGENRRLLMSIIESDGFGYPTTVILDRAGIIRAVWQGVPNRPDDIERAVADLLARLRSEAESK
jgi:cytochrome c biogenesis protein CcmG, thiol:disulfide interchange protein DsbE